MGGSVLAVPVLVIMIYSIFRFGLLFQANAGMQHALGEGARYATLCLNPDPDMGCSIPSDTQIQSQMTSNLWGQGYGSFTVQPITTAGNQKTLTVTYSTPMDFLLLPGPTVTFSRSKVVYLAGIVPTPPAT